MIRKIAIGMVFCAIVFGNFQIVESQDGTGTLNIEVYDYNTGEFMGSMSGAAYSFTLFENENSPIPTMPTSGLGWEGIGVISIATVTDSQYTSVAVQLDASERRIFVQISGENGDNGTLYLGVTKSLLSSPENVKAYLDNQPVDVTVYSGWGIIDYVVKAEYTLNSTRIMRFDFSRAVEVSDIQFFVIILGAAVVSGIVLYLLRFRR